MGGNGVVEGRRYASVKSQGAYRIPNKKTIGKKLGAKKSGGMLLRHPIPKPSPLCTTIPMSSSSAV